MADVALRNVVKRFDKVDAVREISLNIPDKEFVVLVGPSGCSIPIGAWCWSIRR